MANVKFLTGTQTNLLKKNSDGSYVNPIVEGSLYVTAEKTGTEWVSQLYYDYNGQRMRVGGVSDRAAFDSMNQSIVNTYIKQITMEGSTYASTDGATLTYTKGDGSTVTILLPLASETKAGTVNTGAQTFAGNKTFKGQVILQGGTDTAGTTANSGALIIGSPTGAHISMDANEIQAKAASGTTAQLYINNDGGITQFGGVIQPKTDNVFTLGTEKLRWKTVEAVTVNATTFNGFLNGNVKGNLDGNAASADKWYTARAITLGSDLQGSVSIDGSKNVTLNAQHYNVSCSSNNKSNYPWHRIATTGVVTGNYGDKDMTIVIRHSYSGGGYGVAKVSLRTNASGSNSSASVKWLYRYNIGKEDLQIGLRNTSGNTLADLYYKVGTWARVTIYQVEGNRSWTLIASSEVSDTTTTDKKTSKEVYTSVSNGSTILGAGYTDTIKASDGATVQNANYATSADGAITDNANHAILTHYLSKIDFDGAANKATKVVVNLYNGNGAIKTTVDFPTASASQAGAITTGTQTLTGAKTLDANGSLTIQKNAGFNYSGIGTASDAIARHVWFSHSSNKGMPILSDKFKYNPASTDKWATVVANATDKTSAAYGKLIVDVLEGIAARAYGDDRGQQITKKYVASLSFDGTTNKASKVTMTYNDGTGAEIATVNFPTASANSAGAITTGTQTLTGAKTLDANGSLTIQKASGFNYSGIESASSNSARHVWFSHGTNVGTPVKNDKFKVNPGATDTWATVVANATDKTGSTYSKLIVNVLEGIAARAYADDRGQKISTKYVASMAFSGTGSTVTLTYQNGAGADLGSTNIPVASSSAAGIVTNTTQTIAGDKTFTGRIYIKNTSDAVLGTADTGALVIGDKAGEHIIIDSNEIMGKANGTTSRELLFQWDGGNTGFGGMILPKTNQTSSVGSSSRRWNEIFAYIFNAATKFTTGGGTFYADSNGDAYFANSVGVRVKPDSNYALKIGGESWFADDVYTDAPVHIGETTAANALLYLNKKLALKGTDTWLRINDTGAFTAGSYFGNTIVRTDGQFQVNSGGSKFYANSSGNGYFSNTLGIAGTNTNHKLYVNGSTLHNGYVYFANGNVYFVDNSGQGKFNRLNVGYSGTTFDTGYTVKVNGTGYFENSLRVNNHIYGSLADNKIDITINGDANTYYPVVITSNPTTSYAGTILSITRGYSEKAPDTWHTATHRGGLTLTLLWNGSRYWDGNGAGGFTPDITNILQHYESYCTMVAGLESATTGLVVWLRGGGAVYHIYSQRGTLLTASVKMTAYTDGASRTFSPKTSVDKNNLNPKKHWVLRGGDTMLGTLNTQDIYPKTNNTYNAGSSSMRYKEIHGYTIFAHTKFQNPAGSFYADSNGRMYVQNGTGLGIAPDTAGTYILKVKGNSLFNGILYLANGTTYYIDNSAQAKIRGIIGNLYMRTANSSIHWDDGTYQQRIATTDDSTANTNVFMFQQSADTGSTWKDLFKIQDDGVTIVTDNTGQFRKIYSAASTVPTLLVGSTNQDATIWRVYSSDSTYKDIGVFGYSLKYRGTGSGNNNFLTLYTDNQTATAQNIAYTVNQTGEIGIRTDAVVGYSLYVNGKVKIAHGENATSATTGALQVTGGISVQGASWFKSTLTSEGALYIGSADATKAILYLNKKIALRGIDTWLRINDTVAFTSGVYFGKSLVMTDNELRVRKSDASANTFYANSAGNAYISNTLGIAGINTSYKLYVNGTTLHNGVVYFANGTTYFVNNSAHGHLATLALSGDSSDSYSSKGYKLYVGGTAYFKGDVTYNANIYLPKNGQIFAIGSKATSSLIRVVDNTVDTYGNGISIGGGGLVVVGAGESASSMVSSAGKTGGDENLYLTADGVINIEAGGDTIANRRGIQIGTNGNIIPVIAEAAQSVAFNIGTTTNAFQGMYSNWVHANAKSSSTDGGFTLYGGSATYSIYMRTTATQGTHGYTTGDWATYFNMNDSTTRGWIFKAGGRFVASISGAGYIVANRLSLQRANSTNYGRIYWYNTNYKTWITYMSNNASASCPTGGTPSVTTEVTTWALRSLIENTAGYGWIWEACANTSTGTPTARMSLSSNTGRLRIEGNASSSTNITGQLIVSSEKNGSSGNTAIELWRGGNASWQMANENGTFYIRSNYTSARQSTYSVNSLILDYNTGAASLPYLALGQTARNTSYRLYVYGTSYFYSHAYLPNNASIIQNQSSTSNYTTVIKWYKGGTSQATYDPQIGQHNTGGDGTGSISILPYATATSPWGGTVGLFIQKNLIKLDDKRIPTTGNNTGTVGSGTKPIYSNAGVLTASSSTVGGTAKPIYLNAGTMTACSATVGSTTKPVYMNAGTITAFSSTIGGVAKPVYIKAGDITACSSTVGGTTRPVYMNAGTITAITSVGTAYGGTGVTSHTANRLVWSTSATTIQAGYHYADSTKVAINYASAPSYNFYVSGTAYHTGRLYLAEWIQFTGKTGLYFPSSGAGTHLYPNTVSTYGSFMLQGAKGGYIGFLLGPNNTYMNIMTNGTNEGLYNQSTGRWIIHYNRSSNLISIGSSSVTSGYILTVSGSQYVNGSVYVTSQFKVAKNGGSWISGRANAAVVNSSSTTSSSFAPIFSAKVQGGSWDVGPCHPNTNLYFSYATDTNYNAGTNTTNYSIYFTSAGYIYATRVYKAVWNDYAEFREAKTEEPGRVVIEGKFGVMKLSTERLQPGGNIISDTYGDAMGQTEKCKTPIAIAGRVLAYTYEDINSYELGDAVCTGPNGTVSKMSREEIREWPDRIIGTVSEIPTYETWGTGNIKVNGRIWIKVK